MQTAKEKSPFFLHGKFPRVSYLPPDGPCYGAVRLGRRGILAFHHVNIFDQLHSISGKKLDVYDQLYSISGKKLDVYDQLYSISGKKLDVFAQFYPIIGKKAARYHHDSVQPNSQINKKHDTIKARRSLA